MFEFLFLSFLTFATTHADTDYVNYAYLNCSTDTDAGSVFKFNLDTLLRRLSNATTDNGFNKTNVTGENPSDSVFGLFMCRADVPSQLCRQCVNKAAQQLALDCSYSQQALIWYDDCMLRYSNHSFFSTLDTRPKFTVTSILNISNEESFRRLLFRTINDTPEEATSPPHLINAQMFATRKVKVSGFQWLYFMAQCTPYLSSNDCKICLEGAIGDLLQCCGGRQGGTVLYPSCFVRYELYPFYRHIDPSASPSHPPVLVRHIPVPASNFSNADSQYSQNPTYLYHNCSADATADSDFNEDLDTLLSYLSSNATKSYHKVSVDNNVYGLFMCRGDLPSQLCQQCVLNATNCLSSRCNSSQEAIIWFSHCMLRYSGNKFFSNMEKSPMFQVLNVTATSSPFPGQDDFVNTLSTTLATLAKAAGDSAEKYVTESSTLNDEQTLYTLGQCTQDLSSEDCVRCLTDIKGRIPWSNLGSVGGRILCPSCNIRFELFQFYRAGGDPASSPLQERIKGKSRAMISVIVPTMISLTLLSLVCYLINYYLMKRKRRKNVKTILREQFGHESVALEPFQFKLSVIEVATNNFSQENKIGRGGFGEVYKGVLDGRQIAVKRLSISSRQGENEFKNEVLSIAKLQHRNLVGFIGFCLEEQDRILIYEYVPNKSLDYFLFDSQRSKLLGWHERYNIIVGVARGILYLHEQSRLKVIHRDLKPSNILLDENMIPKISDFGLARIVEINQDEGSTLNLAGTYGYMSPEYLAFGRFSEKSDVFSFGVMILEIITGKKNASSYESNRIAYDLLSYVWRQWNDHATLGILDPSIKENFSEIEVNRCIQIGLLSVQPSPNARPTMAEIVSYISSYLIELPSPQEHAFGRLDRPRVLQESNSSQSANGSTLFSLNEISLSEFLPR